MGQNAKRLTADIVVIGAGPVGLTAAIALAGAGIETTLIARRTPADNRTTALLAGSVTALDTLGIWGHTRDFAAPLLALRIIDDTRRLLRAPEAYFEAGEIGLPEFGHNIENRYLVAAMETRASELRALTRLDDEVEAVEISDGGVSAHLKGDGCVRARLAIGADGRHSLCRSAAGIDTTRWNYPQTALTFNIRHARPHRDTSTEFHTETGPFTLVPLPGLRSSIVCVVAPDEANRLRSLTDAALAAEIERRSHSILGEVEVEPERGSFPLAVETANVFAANRIMLAGEAAHRIPPIGAQGLNLGLRDAATIAELVSAAAENGDDLGGADLLSRYETMRRADVTSRAFAIDLLNRTLLSEFLPFQGARGLGIFLMNQIGSLRRAVMREGVAPITSRPLLMRGVAVKSGTIRS